MAIFKHPRWCDFCTKYIWRYNRLSYPVAKKIALQISLDSRVLEIGTGTGLVTSPLTKLIGDCKMVLTDPSKEMLKVARQKIKKNKVSFLITSGENLPFKVKAFDVVFTVNTLHHVFDISKTVKEMKRVCQDRILVCDIFAPRLGAKKLWAKFVKVVDKSNLLTIEQWREFFPGVKMVIKGIVVGIAARMR